MPCWSTDPDGGISAGLKRGAAGVERVADRRVRSACAPPQTGLLPSRLPGSIAPIFQKRAERSRAIPLHPANPHNFHCLQALYQTRARFPQPRPPDGRLGPDPWKNRLRALWSSTCSAPNTGVRRSAVKPIVRFFHPVAVTACHPGDSLMLHPFVLYRLVRLGEPAGTFMGYARCAPLEHKS